MLILFLLAGRRTDQPQPWALAPAIALGALGQISKTGATGLEPATSGVTGRRSNQLSYAPRACRL
jgi:hypothetical protein